MRNPGGKVPKVTFVHVRYEALSIRVNRGDSRASIKHEGPLRSRMPVQFANTPGGEPHVNPGYRFRDRQLTHRHLARPSSRVKALVRERERILKHRHRSRVGDGRHDGTRVLRIKGRVRRARIALAFITHLASALLCFLSRPDTGESAYRRRQSR